MTRTLATTAVLALYLCPMQSQAKVNEANLAQQRHQFQQAEYALRMGRLGEYRLLEAKLRDYPLHLYLDYADLKRRLASVSDTDVESFLQRHNDSPMSARLQQRWLSKLAKQGQWQRYKENYRGSRSVKMQCHYAYALQRTNDPQASFQLLEQIWPSSRSLPRECDRPIAAWKKSGQLSNDLLWQRIRLAMQKGRVSLARHLAKDLPKEEQFWVNVWTKVRRDPTYLHQLHQHFEEVQPRVLGWITVYGLRRQSGRKPFAAAESWQRLKARYHFSANEIERIESRLALALLNDNSEEAQRWLKKLKLSHADDRVISLHFFSAMQDQDWDTALAWLERISEDEQHSERWRYWRGRLLEAMGHLEEARSVYVLNGEARSYYSFLAADRAGQQYRFADVPLQYKKEDLSDLTALPAMQRARELIALNRTVDARREWNFTISRLPHDQQLKAATLANQWGWHDRVIATLAKAKYWDDLELRFPLAHQKFVLSQATQQHINPAWAFAIIRQESAFTQDARSHAGALGLMQLLPRTARSMARTMRLRRPKHRDLLKAETNIRLGVRYLKNVKDKYQGHPVLATAAYNAGPHRVKQWLPEHGSIAADLWVEKVPFTETRNYLKRVLTYTVIYEQRLGRQPVPLLERMTPVTLSGFSPRRRPSS